VLVIDDEYIFTNAVYIQQQQLCFQLQITTNVSHTKATLHNNSNADVHS
jgi:hypothetical protein